MVSYSCEKCKKEFLKKSNYLRHIELKKKPCVINNELGAQNCTFHEKTAHVCTIPVKNAHFCTSKKSSNIKDNGIINIDKICTNEEEKKVKINNKINNNIICDYCNNVYTRTYCLKRHQLTCKLKNTITNEFKKEIDELKIKNKEIEQLKNDEIEKLKNEVEKLNNSINNKPIININNTNNSNNTTNNNIQINIVNYGEEDLTKLDIKKILTYDNSFIEMVFRDIHCNRELPEYQNILLPSLSRYDIYVKLNNEWLKRNKREILKERYLTIRDYIMELYTEESEKNKNKAEQIYFHFLKQIKLVDPTNNVYKPDEEKKIIDGIANVLYNHKHNIKSIDKEPIIINKKMLS